MNYSARFYARKHSLSGDQFRSYDPVIQSEPLIEEMVNRCSMGEVLYDVGAHVGVFSLLAARLGLESIAFEPNPDAYSRLIANIEANEFESTTPLNVGISDENDKLEFYVSSQQARSSFNQENAEFGVAEVIATERISVTLLDNYQGKLQPTDI